MPTTSCLAVERHSHGYTAAVKLRSNYVEVCTRNMDERERSMNTVRQSKKDGEREEKQNKEFKRNTNREAVNGAS